MECMHEQPGSNHVCSYCMSTGGGGDSLQSYYEKVSAMKHREDMQKLQEEKRHLLEALKQQQYNNTPANTNLSQAGNIQFGSGQVQWWPSTSGNITLTAVEVKPTPPLRVVSRTWTITGEHTTRLHVSETPDRKHVLIRVEKAGKVQEEYVMLTRAAFDSLMALRDEIGDRWDADQTIEALGK